MNSDNAANGGLYGDLTGNISDFIGTAYGGSQAAPVVWSPIRDYSGTFGGSHTQTYQLSGLYIEHACQAGLFETIKGGTVSRISVVDSHIEVTSEGTASAGEMLGAIAAEIEGGSISQCYAMGNEMILRAGTTGALGGLVGNVKGNAVVKDCYNQFPESASIQVSGKNSSASANITVGGIAGKQSSAASGTQIQNCYSISKKNKASLITSSGSVALSVGDITGAALTASPLVKCYSDGVLNGGTADGKNGTVLADMGTNEPVIGLNTQVTGGTESLRTGTGRVWYTSMLSEESRGYPTFVAPATVAVTVGQETPENGSELALPGNLSVAGFMLRSFQAVDSTFTPGSTVAAGNGFTLIPYTEMAGASGGYHMFGYADANQKLGVKAGQKDLYGQGASLNQPTTDMGAVDKVTICRAAATTKPETRYLLLEGASGTSRYEIQITVPGITSRTLSVTMPLEVTMAQLTPDGTDHTDYSVGVKITNKNAYPIDGKILSVTEKTGNGYAKLTPVKKSITLPNTGWLTSAAGGVKLGLANQDGSSGPLTEEKYYDKDAVADGAAWMEYRLKHGGSLPYRYVMKYSGIHVSEESRFGYDISYWFGVSKDNYTDTADAVIQ